MEGLLLFLGEIKYKLLGFTAIASGLALLKFRYLSGKKCESNVRLDGRVVIITGSNTGIGFYTALDLAGRGATVIMACRDLNKANKACNYIKKETRNQNVYVELVDLSSFDSVVEFSERIIKKYDKIDILINNAGIYGCPRWVTRDGFEMQLQVNYLSHFLLTKRLMVNLSNKCRVINVTSKLYEKGKIKWDDLNSEQSYDPIESYRQSKLCNILFDKALKLNVDKAKQISVFSVSPGIVLTNLGQYYKKHVAGWKFRILSVLFYPLIWFLMKTPKQGAQTIIYCAVTQNLIEDEHCYFRNCQQIPLQTNATNTQDIQRLWKITENMLRPWLTNLEIN